MESPRNKSDIARMYLEKYAGFSKRAVARVLHSEHPEIFATEERARSLIRLVTGAQGKDKRFPEGTSREKWAKAYHKNALAFKFPKGEKDVTEPFVIPPNIKKLLIVADFQVPFQDERAMEVAFEYGYSQGCDAILMNGDQQDFYGISRFNPDPLKRRIPEELDIMREILGVIREGFPDIPMYWKDGNHEERWEQYLKSHAPALFGAPDFELPVLLRFGEHKIQYVTDKRTIKFGKLFIFHGHEFGSGYWIPVNPARTLSLKAKGCSAFCSHYHQVTEDSKNSADGSMLSWWSGGCLCNLKPRWKPHNDWRHGCSLVERVSDDGEFIMHNKKIIKYKIR